MRKPVLVAVPLLFITSFATAQIPTIEREALISLYNNTDGANWTDNTNWMGAVGTECGWYGLTCLGGHVTRLDLNSNQLSGSIPADLGALLALERLYLNNNQLSGTIPRELGSLSSLYYLNLHSNLLGGSIPPELGNLSTLSFLYLYSNQLSGSIPPELGNLSALRWLYLNSNQLSGKIPSELGGLSSLRYLGLSNNQLSGTIPAELGDLSACQYLYLNSNQLSGTIPPELGNLSICQYLYVSSNRLSGNIPAELGDLSSLVTSDGLDLRWNALHSDDAALTSILNDKQRGRNWPFTQTIAPETVSVDSVSDHTVWLSWDAVIYQINPGGYEVFSAPTGTGVWTTGGWTDAKTDTTFPVTGLDPATPYDFAVVTYTDPHTDNLNTVDSDLSPEVMATTASVGCGQPTIEIAWGGTITLFVTGTYDSYVWSTGETTPTIVVDPPDHQWYWVTVTSPGPCEETAATLVAPQIFANGFESGNTSEWSTTVP